MTRTRRLQPVVEHSDQQEKRALQELAQSQALFEVEQQRLQQLEEYKQDYLQRSSNDSGVFTPIQLQEFNRFIQQLDATIERQAQLVEIRQQELEQKQLCWRDRRIDAKVLHKAVDRIRRQELRDQERSEQKTMDEFALRRGR